MNGFYVTKATAKKYKLKTLSDLAKQSSKLNFGGPPECETAAALPRRHVAAAATASSSRTSQSSTPVGPLTVQALEDGDIDVALLFTGSSVIPKDAVLLVDDKELQPADNPVFLMRKDKATPAALKIVNSVSDEADHGGVQQDVARDQRGQGRPGRRGRGVPEVEQARRNTVALLVQQTGDDVDGRREDDRAEQEREQRVAQHRCGVCCGG